MTDRVEANGELSIFGDGEQVGIFQAQFAGAILVGASHVELVVAAFPGCGIDDAAVGSEAGVAEGSGAEGDLLKLGRSGDRA
jgi:hypothetical protein